MVATAICYTFQGHVVCRQLGFRGAAKITKESRFGGVDSTFAMDQVNCDGYESSIQECSYESHDDCSGGEGAGVVCQCKYLT